MNFKKILTFIKKIGIQWGEDNIPTFAAALAYYMVFSLGPLMVISINIGSIFLEQASVQAEILNTIDHTLGHASARQIETIIQALTKSPKNWMTMVIGLGMLIFGASGAFAQLQLSLNTIWGVKPKPGRGIIGIIRDRFMSFSIVIGVAFLLLISMLLSVLVSAFSDYLTVLLPESLRMGLEFDFIISLTVETLLFAMIFKILPDVQISWRQVWLGALVTAILFTIGKILLGIYLARSNGATIFGAAGSIIIILIWIYYSAQILLLGAEFTKLYSFKYGHQVKPTRHAILINKPEKNKTLQ